MLAKLQKKTMHSVSASDDPSFIAISVAKKAFRFHLTSRYNYFSKIFKQLHSKVANITNNSKELKIISVQSFVWHNINLYASFRSGMNLIKIINSFSRKHPFIAAACCVMLNAVLADAVAQFALENKNFSEYEVHRLYQFAMYSFVMYACISYFCSNHLFFRMFPGTCLKQTFKKVAVEEFALVPFVQFPLFYTFKEICQAWNNSNNNNLNDLKNSFCKAMERYKENFVKDNVAACCVWIPTSMISLGVLPKHLRIPFNTVISFFWLVCLSYARSSDKVDKFEVKNDGANQTSKAIKAREEMEEKEEKREEKENIFVPRRKSYNEKRAEAWQQQQRRFAKEAVMA